MRGIILFDNLNDLAFIDADPELLQHIQRLAFKDGLLEDLSFQDKEGEINKNVVMQLFSPLIASYKVMQVQFGNKYQYIESEDGVLLVFHEILNYIAIIICQKDDSLAEAQKELSLFNVCAEMLYGPSMFMIKENISTCCDDVSRSELLQIILKTWRILKMEQQMFLIEAVERLIINQEITAMCINLLQEILEKVRHANKEATYSHAFLLVDIKLLALYSSRNSGQLPKETLLLLILLVQMLKRTHNSQDDESENLLDDEFFIPVSSPSAASRDSEKKREPLKQKNIDSKSSKLTSGAQTLLIYLKSRLGILVPHILYVLEVAHNINLVILSELTHYAAISSHLSSISSSFYQLQNHPSHRDVITSFENLEAEFQSLIDSLWKMKKSVDKEKNIKKMVSKWKQLKQCDIETLFETSGEKIFNSRLDSTISSVCEVLKSVFEEEIAIPCLKFEEKTWSPEHQETLFLIQKLAVRRLVDVGDFLEVKAMQNITMASLKFEQIEEQSLKKLRKISRLNQSTNGDRNQRNLYKYISEYPGLLHFIYVDRSCDCLIAPSVVLRKGHLNGIATLKKKIWNMVSVGRRYIDGVNKFCCLWKDDDLYFYYNIWFENCTGKIIKPTAYPSLKNFPEKGIICGNFYKKLLQECFPGASYDHIFCYEIFCVHLDSTPIETIVDHSRKLSSQLWDFTGAYRTSLDLL